MSERCELSDLPVGQCACRVHGPQPERSEATGVRTEARYPGHCEGCSERIRVGDTIVMDTNGLWICEACG
jgi:hypothetical protein